MSEYCENCFEFAEKLTEKEQECESLKEEVQILQDNFDTATRDCNDLIDELRQECEELEELLKLRADDRINKLERAIIRRNVKIDRYRKALEEIEEYAKNFSEVDLFKDIKDIINKVKDSE